jgi:molybdate transport system substrate-binding protein
MRRLLPLLALAALVAGCRSQPATHDTNAPARPAELTVSAAVSLKDAFNEIGRLYEQRTGTRVRFNFGASGVLQKQIEQGAPVDVFASAGERQMNELVNKDRILSDTRRDFARNALVLIVPAGAPVQLNAFDQLARANVRKVAIGNPQTVPAGQYAQQLLVRLKLWEQLQPKLVWAEDVRQVLDYVARGETDAGIVYASDVVLARDKVANVATAQPEWHDPILYPIAIVTDCQNVAAAQQFVELVLSAEGQGVLTKYGFRSATL